MTRPTITSLRAELAATQAALTEARHVAENATRRVQMHRDTIGRYLLLLDRAVEALPEDHQTAKAIRIELRYGEPPRHEDLT